MSGTITITPGYTFPNDTTAVTHTRLNSLGTPTAQVDAGAITSRELASSAQLVDPTLNCLFYEDFVVVPAGGVAISGSGTFAHSTSSGTVEATAGTAAHPGVIVLIAANSATAYGWVRTATVTGAVVLGGGETYIEWVIREPNVLSNASNTYTVTVGLANAASTGAVPTDGIYFTYTHGTNSGKWVGTTANASTRSTVNSNVTVALDTWRRLRAVANAGATSVEFFIDGASIGSLTANIPTAALVPVAGITKTVNDATQASFAADYCKLAVTFTTAR